MMILKAFWNLFLLLLLLGILGCSTQDQVTGAATAAAGLLQVTVVDEEGELLGDATIFVDGIIKGTTSKYGASKGTKLVILDDERNKVFAEKEGYTSTNPILVSRSSQEQLITIVLKKTLAVYAVKVIDDGGQPLPETEVALYLGDKDDNTEPVRWTLTQHDGKATFASLHQGDYRVEISKEKYFTHIFNEAVASGARGLTARVQLERRPYLQVNVRDSHGQRISRAEVTVYRTIDYNTPGKGSLTVMATDREGRAELIDVELGESYTVIIKKEGFTAETQEKTIREGEYQITVAIKAREGASSSP